MFGFRTLLAIGLVAVQGACSQVSTASLFPIIDANGESLQGQIVGTGTDGTTYVLSGQPTATNAGGPATFTLVQDASHVSEFAAESTGSVSAEFHVECGFDSASQSHGVCTLEEILANGANATTILTTDTGTVTLTPVLVSSSGASASITGTVTSTTNVASSTQSSSSTTRHVVDGLGAATALLLAVHLCARL